MGLAPYANSPADLPFFVYATTDGYSVDGCYIRKSILGGSIFDQFYSKELVSKLGSPRRKGEPVTQHYKNIGVGAQLALETARASLVTYLHQKTGENNLCLAVGVSVNCNANGILAQVPFVADLFVQPAAFDRGLTLGCALHVAHDCGENIKPTTHVFHGPTQKEDAIERALAVTGMTATVLSDPAETAAALLAEGSIVGWFQGRSEFGPRALGHRSILANSGLANMKDEINVRMKYREEFRPFAPSVLEERACEIFDMVKPSPYMTVAFNVRDG